jgi:hypothetical protein
LATPKQKQLLKRSVFTGGSAAPDTVKHEQQTAKDAIPCFNLAMVGLFIAIPHRLLVVHALAVSGSSPPVPEAFKK